MARGPRGPRKRGKPNRSQRQREYIQPEYELDDDIPLSETPEYKRRMRIIRLGTGILLFAFITTSGITCVASSFSQRAEPGEAATAANGTRLDPVSAEISRIQEEIKATPGLVDERAELAEYLLERASQAKEAQAGPDLDEAQKQLDAALKVDPNKAAVHQMYGQLYLAREQADKASSEFEQALKLSSVPVDPKAPDKEIQETAQQAAQVKALEGLASAAVLNKDYDKALSSLDQALKLNPGEGSAYIMRGRVQILRKQPEAARKDFQFALGIASRLGNSPAGQSLMNQAVMGLSILEPKTPTPTPGAPSSAPPAPTPLATPSAELPVALPGGETAPGNATSVNATSVNATSVNATP